MTPTVEKIHFFFIHNFLMTDNSILLNYIILANKKIIYCKILFIETLFTVIS